LSEGVRCLDGLSKDVWTNKSLDRTQSQPRAVQLGAEILKRCWANAKPDRRRRNVSTIGYDIVDKPEC
jgi:hypothetical protein